MLPKSATATVTTGNFERIEMATLTPNPKLQFLNANGVPLVGGKLYTYAAGTSTPQDTYTDASGLTPATNPIILDAAGEASVWLGGLSYKFKLTDASDVEVWSVDNISSNDSFTQDSPTAVTITVQQKLTETISVQDFGAVGNGVTNDSTAFVNTDAFTNGESFLCPPNHVYNIGNTQPDFNLTGNGSVLASSVTTGSSELSYNPATECVFFIPETYQREVQGINYPPPRGADYLTQSYKFIMATGSALNDDTKNIRYTVAVGNLIGSAPNSWGYMDVFGGNTLAYAYNTERTSAVGSESLVWFGAPNQAWLVTYQHDWWRMPPDNPYVPGQAGWDASGLETLFPGIGDRLAAYNSYAVDSTEAGFTATLGRDSGNHMVKGVRNVFTGYAAGGNIFDGSYNVAVGALSLQNAVFCNYNTAVGDQAGKDCLDSVNATFAGYGAGRTVQNATSSVFIGDRTADSVISAQRAVVIGALAGASHPTNLDDKLVISNTRSTIRDPLICGNFVSEYAGIALQPEKLRAKWHVQEATSGSTRTPVAGILLEGNSSCGMTVETSATGFGKYCFADPDAIEVGKIEYSHSSNSMVLTTNGTSQVRVDSTGVFRPASTDNTQSLGTATNRWSVVYAGTGTINTSDERAKQQIKPIDAAALRAWGKVEYVQYKFNDAVAKKGNGARWHFGLIAQRVKEAFESEGLDAFEYGLLCYDEWDAVEAEIDETGEVYAPAVEAGNRYGIRYEEALALECAYLRSKLA